MHCADTWDADLECVASTCFKGGDAAADIFVFLSAPVLWQRFALILQATLNSRTGRSFIGGGPVDMGISNMEKVFPSLSGEGCVACFSCKVKAYSPNIEPLTLMLCAHT